MTLDNLFLMDGLDIWTTFNISVESGSDDFLKIPERKSSIEHEWLDEDGIDVDLTRTFFKAREINLRMFGIHESKDLFWQKYEQLIALLRSPGARRLTVARHDKDYFVYFTDNKTYQSFNFFYASNGKVLTKFSLTFHEPRPMLGYVPTFLIEEQGRFIIT